MIREHKNNINYEGFRQELFSGLCRTLNFYYICKACDRYRQRPYGGNLKNDGTINILCELWKEDRPSWVERNNGRQTKINTNQGKKNKPSAATLHARSRQTAQISGSSEEDVEHCIPYSLQRTVQKISHLLLTQWYWLELFK